MYTSDIELNRRQASKTAFVYLLVALFFVLFGAVYEIYSHEVYSYYMLYAFTFPLIGGTLVFNILSFLKLQKYPNAIARNLYHSGIATLTVGSVVQGVLEIYGTTNALSDYYWSVGIVLIVIGVVAGIVGFFLQRREQRYET